MRLLQNIRFSNTLPPKEQSAPLCLMVTNDSMDVYECIKVELRENRVKDGIDYAIVHKYGRVHVLCNVVWMDIIAEIAQKHSVRIDDWHTYTV